VREGLGRNDYKDPGWYKHPPGTQAREWTSQAPVAPKADAPAAAPRDLNVRKPSGHGGH